MWEPRHLTTLWASTACYRDSFTFYYLTLIFTKPHEFCSSCQTQQYTNLPANISLCITEFIDRTMSLRVSVHRAIIRRYINKLYTLYYNVLMYRLMMALWAETCSDLIRLLNSVMHREMLASWLVYCCVWQEEQNSYIVLLVIHKRMNSLKFHKTILTYLRSWALLEKLPIVLKNFTAF
jgi:hypothetical protein